MLRAADFGSGYLTGFPSEKSPGLNAVATDERLIDAAQQLLDNRDIRLIQSVGWAK